MFHAMRLVLVDVDGTCVFCEERNQKAIEEAAREGGFEITPEHWKTFKGAGDAVIWEKIVDELEGYPGRQQQFRDQYPGAEVFEEACLARYARHTDKIGANPVMWQLVHDFLKSGFDVIPVSNSKDAALRQNLAVTNYPLDRFPFTVSKDDVVAAGGRIKPAPDPYLCALQYYNAMYRPNSGYAPTAGECLVFEDSGNGAKAATAAGMTTIHILDDMNKKLDTTHLQERGAGYHPVAMPNLDAFVRRQIPRLQYRQSPHPKAG